MKDDKKNPMTQESKGNQQTQSNQPNRGNPQKGTDEGKPSSGNEKIQTPERGGDDHQHENKRPVSNPKEDKGKGGDKPGDTATGTTQEGSTGTEKGAQKKSVSSDSMGGGASSAGGGGGNVD